MSSYFDEASLVMIPSGYKDQKVYSIKPLDGAGDLVFSRASSATRVASNGLIEKVRSNRFTYSQALANAAWLTAGNGGAITKTANAGTAPDGTNTATRIQIGGGGTYSLVYQNGVNPLGLVVISGYFKRYGSTNQTFRLFGDNGSALSGTLTATDTWQRFSYVMNASSTGADGIAADASNNAYDILVWGMQIETGDIATDYIATTSAAVSVGPVSGLPRLDYLNSTCPRLLLEPQRTNLVIYSEQFDNAGWGKSQSGTGLVPVVTANNAISPDGYSNADTIVFNSGAGTTASDISAIFQTFGGTTATYTGSFYAKTASGTAQVQVRIDGSNYDKFTITNQWQRFTLTKALTGTGNVFEMAIRRGLNEPMNASATIQLWGVQVELGAYATSYIPTLGTSVTRVADEASKTGISSLIGQTEGTLFADVNLELISDSAGILGITGSGTTFVYLFKTSGNVIAGNVYIAGVIQAAMSYAMPSAGRYKVAVAYKQNDFVLYVNGVQRASDNSGSVPTCTDLFINNSSFAVSPNSNHNQALLFKTRLTNESLAALTSL